MKRSDSEAVCAVCGASDWGSRGRCKPCRAREAREYYADTRATLREKRNATRRAWRRANPEKERAASRRKRYGVTQEQVDELLLAQNGVCRICSMPNPDSVDHCHVTGRVRGLLCRACNAGLGLFQENLEVMRAAAAYLLRGELEKM